MKWKMPRVKTAQDRVLEDLVSVGPATSRQLISLGVRSVKELARSEPETLYEKLCRKTKKSVDPCVLDVYRAAVAQARNPELPDEQRVWWYWSRVRKGALSAEKPGAQRKKR